MSNRRMSTARSNPKDEFYTQVSDIENELRHYQDKFIDKILYMNTDHPDHSMFYWHFKMLFEVYGLKKIIATFWSPEGGAFKTVYDGKEEKRTPLDGDGDFRSDECIEILKKSDVIVTNPPFSLFREYVNQLMEYQKEFLIVGNNNATSYKEIFPLIRDNKIWLGNSSNTTMEFKVSDEYEITNNNGRIDSDGNKYLKVPSISWFTNIEYPKRYDDLLLWTSYKGSEDYYPKYDNYDAINVDRVSEIPYDYEGVMGVPITFLSHWNPNQFEIIGLGKSRDLFTPNVTYENPIKGRNGKEISVSGEANNVLLLNAGKEMPIDKTYYTADNVDGYLIAPYARVLIRNLNPVDEIAI